MKKNILLTLGLAAMAFTSQAFTSDACTDVQPTPQGFDQGYGVDQGQLPAGYNAPSRIATAGSWSAFISASFIYWLPKEKGLEVAATSDSVDGSNPLHTTIHDVGHEYKPGFKVALGFNIDHDNWVIDFGYTRFHSRHGKSAHVNTDTGELVPYFLQSDNNNSYIFSHASAKWRVNMDLLEVNLSRPFYNGRHLTLSPVAGIRGGWLGQKYGAKYTEIDNGDVYFAAHQKSWLVGPQAGLNARWLLGMGFRFFGDMTAALFYQRFNLTSAQTQAEDPVTTNYMHTHHVKSLFSPYFDINLGLGYGSYFCDSKWHFDLSIGYEFQIYWEQNHIRYIENDLNSSGTLRGLGSGNAANLLLHGLTVTARVDF